LKSCFLCRRLTLTWRMSARASLAFQSFFHSPAQLLRRRLPPWLQQLPAEASLTLLRSHSAA